jgi:hypothetical protein
VLCYYSKLFLTLSVFYLVFQAPQVYTDHEQPPPIFITSPDSNSSNSMVHPSYFNLYDAQQQQQEQQQFQSQQQLGTNSRSVSPLTVQTQGLNISRQYDPSHQSPLNSPQPYEIPLPPSPSPSAMMSDDEHPYSPHSPMSNNNMFNNVDGRQGPMWRI